MNNGKIKTKVCSTEKSEYTKSRRLGKKMCIINNLRSNGWLCKYRKKEALLYEIIEHVETNPKVDEINLQIVSNYSVRCL